MAGFYFPGFSVAQEWSETPLKQGVCNGFLPDREMAEKMSVLYLLVYR